MAWRNWFTPNSKSVSNDKENNTVPSQPLGYLLEPRMLFDGAVAATVATIETTTLEHTTSDSTVHDAAGTTHDTATTTENHTTAATDAVATSASADNQTTAMRKEVAFIDTSVTDYQTLVNNIKPSVDVVVIDGSKDGLQQMADWASTHSGYDAIHVFSHGSEDILYLGTNTITDASLKSADIQTELASVGKALAIDGDILLYGCDIAAGSDGQQFITDFATLTHADISASTDTTGAATKGGNWVLESRSGLIEAKSLAVDDFTQVMANATLSVDGAPANPDGIGPNFGDTLDSGEAGSTAGGNIQIYFTDRNGTKAGYVAVTDLSAYGGSGVGIYHANTVDNMNYADWIDTAPADGLVDADATLTKYMVIKKQDGSDFSFKELKVVFGEKATLSIEGFNNGSSTGSITYTNSDTSAFQYVSLNTALTSVNYFNNVDEIKVTGYSYIDSWEPNAANGTLHVLDTSFIFTQSITLGDPIIPAPTITSATYNASTGVLAVTGTNMTTGDTIDVSKLTLTGEGGSTYTLTSDNVSASSATAFSVTLNATDLAAINQIFNKDGASSTSATTYNLAAADDWDTNVTSGDTADATNAITTSNVAAPAITSATYDASTGTLAVTGTGFLKLSGATNDIFANKFTLTGEGGSTYTLTDTSNVEITSGTSFTLNLSATDKAAINQIFNKNGTSSTSATTYNLSAAEDWAAGAAAAVTEADLTGNGITTSNVAAPVITSATYDASSGALAVTGTGFLKLNGATNDIVANKLTLTGEGGSTYTLTDTSNVEITSGTAFTLTLSATDKAAINQIFNKNGTSSSNATTYNLAAAEDWAAGAAAAVTEADLTGNGITTSNVAAPVITSATYDASSGALAVTGTGFLKLNGATNDIVANKLTLTGEGGSTYTLTDTSNVEITSGTAFTVTLSATDKAAINQIFNKNGTSSTSATTYNLAAAEDWAAGAAAAVTEADLTGNGITTSNVAAPVITSATYDASSGALAVTGTGFLKLSGATNDIFANKLTLTGEGGSTYTLTDTSNVEITSGTAFTVTLSATDKAAINQIFNKNGTSSTSATTYNLAAAEDWAAGADASVTVADLTGNGITTSNGATPTITSATYDASTGALAVTGTGFLKLSGATNDIDVSKLTFTGEGGSTYTLTDSADVEISSGTAFTVTLSATDKAAINLILNKNGTSSPDATTYNMAGTEDWAAGADAAVTVADLTGNGVTVSNFNATPVISNLNSDNVAWAGVSNTVTLDASSNVSITDTELGALNSGNGNWSGSNLIIQRAGTAVSADTLSFNTSGALFTVSGSNLQSGGLTFATFTNTGGVLTITFTSSGTTATTALVNDVAQHITYRNDTPAGDATVRFTLSDGTSSTTADVTVTSDTIYVTNTTDTATINVSDGVSLSEAVAIATADSTGTQTIVFANSLAGQTITLAGNLAINESLNFDSDSASGLTVSGSTITLGGGTTQTWSDGSTHSAALSSTIAGSGGLAKIGAGTLTLGSASNNAGWSGAMSVTGGTLVAQEGTRLPSGTLTLDGGTLSMTVVGTAGTSTTVANAVTIGSGGGTFNIGGGGGANIANFSGVFSGSGALSKNGAAILQLSGSNNASFSGSTTISAGTLRIAGASNLGSGTITLNGATLADTNTGTDTVANAFVIGSSGATFSKTSGTLSLTGTLDGSGSITNSGVGALNHTGSGTLTLDGATITRAASADSVTLTSNIVIGSGGATFDTTGGDVTLKGNLSGTGSLTKQGIANTFLWLYGNNSSYSGAQTVVSGWLVANSATALGSGQITLDTGTTLGLNGGVATFSNNIVLAGDATLQSANTTNTVSTFNGVISETGGSHNLTVSTATGTNTGIILTGTNTYTGTTTISGSNALQINDASNLSAAAITLSGATLQVNGSGVTLANAINLTGSGTVKNANAVTLSGVISGSQNFTKSGAGTLILSNTETYTGSTTVSAGTLQVDGALGATSGVTVASGGTLGGTGSVFASASTNTLTVQNGGTLSPGNSPGTITVNGNLTMNSGSTLAIEINGTTAGTQYDQVIVNGAVNVSEATLATTHNYTSGSGDSYTIIVNDASDTVTGTFSGLSEGGTTTASGDSTVLTASYVGGTGNDVTLTAPTFPVVTSVSSSSANGTYKIGDTITINVTFDNNVTVNTTGGTPTLLLETGSTDHSASYVSGSGSNTLTFNYTVQQSDTNSDLDYVSTSALALNGGTIQDSLTHNATLTLATPGTANSLGANKAIVVDGVRPTATIAVADNALQAGETSLVTITFSEAVSSFTTADLTVANGTLSSASSADGGITWIATLTPTASITDTSNVITLDNTGVADLAGNAGSGSTDSNNYAIDTARPTASIVVADTALSIGETSLVTITFSEAVSGFTTADLTVANGVVSSLSSSDGGITWTATLTPTASTTDTTNLITLDNTGVADAAGNAGTGTTDSNNYAIDTARPTASILVADSALKIGDTSLVTITFSEAVTGFTNADLTVANGTLSSVASSDGGITWTATLTPTASITDTSNLITLDNTGVADAAGNAGTGTTDSNNYAIDTAHPTASIVVADTALSIGETSLVTITFSEAVTGFTNADLTVANGTLSTVSSSDGGITWTATLTPTASTTDSTNLITVDNTGMADAAGNAGTGTTDSNNYAIDTARPTASILVADSALKIGDTSLVTITFSEAVTGFTNADLTVANGTLSSVASSDGGITWTATLTPTASITDTSNLITLDNTGVADAAGNAGTGTTDSNNYAIDTARPTASILVADSALKIGDTSLVTITFSEAVTGFTNADLTVANGTLSSVASSDGGITWTATLTPTASITDTSNLITLDNTGVADAAGNAGTGTTDSNNYAIDTAHPTASIVVADTALQAGETSLVTITFSEAVNSFTTADLTVANGTLSSVSSADGGITWTATLTPTASLTDTTNLITLDNTGVADLAGNAGTGSTDSNNYAIDTARPTATIAVADNALKIGDTSLVTITFSEAVTGFTNADLIVANGTLSTVSSSDGGITWTATLTPTASITDTSNVITLDNTGVADLAGNAGSGSTDSNNYAIDTVRPTASIVVADTALQAGETSLVTITFSEAVSGFTTADLMVANGTLSSVSSADGGITWTATLTPTASITDTSNVITLDNTGVADLASNAGSGSTDSNNYAIDTVRPTASIVVADTALQAGETSLVTITFSEAVSGFTTADLTVANGTLSSVSSADGGITWTATLTPTASITDTSNVITLDNTGVADLAGNAGSGSTDSNNYAIDTVRPTASIVVADTALQAGETSLVTITFSEAVSGFTTADLTVANGTLSSVSSADGGITWTATLTPTASITDTSNVITLDNTGVADLASNAGSGSTDSNNYAIDTARPTASIVIADTALKFGETSLVTITFSEAVSGFTTADLTVANGVVSSLSSSDGGITWTATLTPTASITDTSNLITLDNTGVADAAGNAGTGTTDSNNYAIDTAHPTASIVVADTALSIGETSLVTITFSEAVTGFTNADLTVANGTLSSVASSDGGITWTATLTPTASITDTSNLITLDNTGVADAAGNAGTGTTDSNNYAIDTAHPTASIVVADTALQAGETSLVTITFSEAVNSFTTADLTVANGTLSSVSSADGGITWTATLTPTASLTDTTNLITLDNTGVADLAGNAGTGSTDSNNYAIDTARPTATIAVADNALKIGDTSLVTITFSEAVTGFTNADLIVANGTLSTVSSSDGGITWTATLTPTASITDTSNVITLDNTGVADLAGNAGSGSTDSNNYAIDTVRPTASIVVADTALQAGETSLVTITFSEAVSGFTTADLMVANGTLSSVSSADGGITWTATLTPTASLTDTTNLITLDNTGVADAAGNAGTGTTDSNNYAIDNQNPLVTSVTVPANGTYVAGQQLDFTVTLNEAVIVDTSAGTPRIAVTLDSGGIVYANYLSGSGTTALTFRLPVSAEQLDTDGVSLNNSIDANGGTLRDAAGNTTILTLNNVGNTSGVQIDAVAPIVTSVTVPADGNYVAGQNLNFTVNLSEAVTIDTSNGTPRLALDLGGTTVYASYVSGSGSNALVFTYIVNTGEGDSSSISLPDNISLNGATIRDAAGNNTVTALHNSAATNNVLIDATAPTPASLTLTDTSAAQNLSYTFVLSEAVTGVDINDFSVLTSGNVTATISAVTVLNSHTYRIDLTNVSGAGSLQLVFNNSGTGVTDAAGNAITQGLTGGTYTITALPGGDPEFKVTDGNPNSTAGTESASSVIQNQTSTLTSNSGNNLLGSPSFFSTSSLNESVPSTTVVFGASTQGQGGGATPSSTIADIFVGNTNGHELDQSHANYTGNSRALGGSSTLAGLFDSITLPGNTPLSVFSGGSWSQVLGYDNSVSTAPDHIFGAPVFAQQLKGLDEYEQRQLIAIETALGTVQTPTV